MDKKVCRNDVTIAGVVISNPNYSHISRGTTYYTMSIAVKRNSGTDDIIPVCFTETVLDPNCDYEGRFFKIYGEYHSREKFYGGKSHLSLSVYADEVQEIKPVYLNNTEIEGVVCKPAYLKVKPSGTRVSEVMISVRRSFGGSSYIPCILWNAAADRSVEFNPGDRMLFNGRIQSRNYEKKFDDGTSETRTAYELSVFHFDKIEENI